MTSFMPRLHHTAVSERSATPVTTVSGEIVDVEVVALRTGSTARQSIRCHTQRGTFMVQCDDSCTLAPWRMDGPLDLIHGHPSLGEFTVFMHNSQQRRRRATELASFVALQEVW